MHPPVIHAERRNGHLHVVPVQFDAEWHQQAQRAYPNPAWFFLLCVAVGGAFMFGTGWLLWGAVQWIVRLLGGS